MEVGLEARFTMKACEQYTDEIPLLFEKYPPLKEKIPWIPLGMFPTPVQRLEKFGNYLKLQNLWIKRDDQSGDLYGGNKVRKLEYILGQARYRGCETLIVFGPTGSNHVLATTIYGKKLGFRVVAILFPAPVTERGRKNLLWLSKMDTEVHKLRSIITLPVHLLKEYVKHRYQRNRIIPYIVPTGGSSPMGCLGYVNAVLELKDQIDRGELLEPDYIFAAVGSGGTISGIVVGTKIAGLKSKVVGVRVVDRIIANSSRVERLSNRTVKLIERCLNERLGLKISPSDFTILQGAFGHGYAVPTKESEEARRLMEEYEGIRLDETYTAKTLAGLIQWTRECKTVDQVILFWNTFDSCSLPVEYC